MPLHTNTYSLVSQYKTGSHSKDGILSSTHRCLDFFRPFGISYSSCVISAIPMQLLWVLSDVSHGTKCLCSGIPVLPQLCAGIRYIYLSLYVYKVSQANSISQFGNFQIDTFVHLVSL